MSTDVLDTSAAPVERPLPKRETRGWITLAVLVAAAVGPIPLMFWVYDREGVGIAALVMMLGLIFLRFPVAVALILPSVLGTIALRGMPAAESAMSDLPYYSTASWTLSVVPMFVLMGLLLWQAGITTKVYDAARDWLSWLPGGLATGTNLAGTGLAAVSGSTIATTYALARVGVPEMIKAGYDRRLAVLAVAVSGLPGQLIPPSIMLVIYAGIAEVPVGPQLMAGVVPGILIAVVFCLVISVISLSVPQLAGAGSETSRPRPTWSSRWRSLGGTWSLPLMIFLIAGGIYSGALTVTEAGAAAALVAVMLAVHYKRRDRPFTLIGRAAVGTVSTTGAIFFLVIAATMFSRTLGLSGVTRAVGEWIVEMNLSATQFLLLLTVMYLIMGLFLEPLAMMLLTVPIIIPTLELLDISLIWFGVFVVFMGELAILTPPVGILTYMIHSIVQDPSVNLGVKISLRDVFVAIGWLMPPALLFVGALIAFPDLATYLPDRLAK